jgi:hypothetical protein
MAKNVRMKISTMEVIAELNNTGIAKAIWGTLPIKGHVNLWGDEIYFTIAVRLNLEMGKNW